MLEEGSEVTRESVLAFLDLNDDSASLLTRTLKRVFPRVSTRRRNEDGLYPLPQIYYSQCIIIIININVTIISHDIQFLTMNDALRVKHPLQCD